MMLARRWQHQVDVCFLMDRTAVATSGPLAWHSQANIVDGIIRAMGKKGPEVYEGDGQTSRQVLWLLVRVLHVLARL